MHGPDGSVFVVVCGCSAFRIRMNMAHIMAAEYGAEQNIQLRDPVLVV